MATRASCLCGGIAYEISGELAWMSHCHCSMCRKSHGAAFATYAAVPASGFRWLRGADQVARYESSPGFFRTFCPRCGSTLPDSPADADPVVFPAGGLEADPGVRPMAHIFVTSKAPWYEICDALPRFDAYPPNVDAPVVERESRSAAARGAIGGSCLCGGVRFELSGPSELIVFCHCSRCRRGHAAAHAANTFVAASTFRWVEGEELAEQYEVPGARRFRTEFCRVCGSSLPRPFPAAGRVNVPAAALDDDPAARPRLHIHTGSKAPWFEIHDSLPQFEEGRPRG